LATNRRVATSDRAFVKSERNVEKLGIDKAKELLLGRIGEEELQRSFLWDVVKKEKSIINFIGIERPSAEDVQSWESMVEDLKIRLPESSRPEFIQFWNRVKKLHVIEKHAFRSVSFEEFDDPERLTHIVVMDTDESPSGDTKNWTMVHTFHVGGNHEAWPFRHFIERSSK